MWRYISPATVFTSSFSTDTTVKTGLVFKTIKKRGAGLANIDAALESLRDNFRPRTSPQDTAGHLILVLRQAKAWLRKMDTKKQKHSKESKGRLQKRMAIVTLANECLDMLVFCSPTLAKSLQSFNANKGKTPGFTMKGLAQGYDHERNLYLKNNKTGLASVSGKGAHEFLDGDTKFNKSEKSALSGSAKTALRKVNQGKFNFNELTDQDFKAIGELAQAKMINAEVKFFDKLERLKLLLTVSAGKLMKPDDTPFASSSLTAAPASGNFPRWDQWMWAMDGHGNLFGSNELTTLGKYFNHSSYMAGKAVACAGILVTSSSGQLLMITNGSGHYKPTRENLFEAVGFLDQEGVDLSACQVACQMHENGNPFIYEFNTAASFLSSPLAQPHNKIPGSFQ